MLFCLISCAPSKVVVFLTALGLAFNSFYFYAFDESKEIDSASCDLDTALGVSLKESSDMLKFI